MHNMAVWVQEELGSVIAIDYVAAVDARSELELTTLCVMLHTEKDIAARRDWDALVELASEEAALAPLLQILVEVRQRESMHEKFWKYVQLFIDVIDDAAQEERAALKKTKGGAGPSKAPTEPKELKKQKEVVAAMESTPQELPPPPSPEELRVMLDKIGAYKERFPNLKSRNKVGPKSSPEEIEDELHYIQLQLGTSTQSGNFGAVALCTAMTCLERSTEYYNPLNLDLRGLGAVTKQNMHEFQPIIDELLIKYNTGLYAPPELRLAMAI
eukprot:jgi/Chrpa1/27426/Chrysochromulina_OHIO_Genome00026162-RA